MTDRELLEYAAKAAGIALEGVEADGRGVTIRGTYWQPLHDDGDALLLAVTLRLDVMTRAIDRESWVQAAAVRTVIEPWLDDPYAATRRAIVRAAAAIGATHG